MNQVLREKFPDGIDRIITGYIEIFKHPIQSGSCAVCGVACELHTNYVCDLHDKICAICLGTTAEEFMHVCKECMIKYDTKSWWYDVMEEINGDIFPAFYRDDETPIDIEYLAENTRKVYQKQRKLCKLQNLALELWVDLEDDPHLGSARRQCEKTRNLMKILEQYESEIPYASSFIRKLKA